MGTTKVVTGGTDGFVKLPARCGDVAAVASMREWLRWYAPGKWGANRRWARTNAVQTQHCYCGAPATGSRSHGPAQFGFCYAHANVPLDAVWRVEMSPTGERRGIPPYGRRRCQCGWRSDVDEDGNEVAAGGHFANQHHLHVYGEVEVF